MQVSNDSKLWSVLPLCGNACRLLEMEGWGYVHTDSGQQIRAGCMAVVNETDFKIYFPGINNDNVLYP